MYRTVRTDIWQDPWFIELQPTAKCLFIYLFTNPRQTSCGAMAVSLSQMAFETKIPARKIEQEIAAFGEKVRWFPDLNYIVVRNFYKHQRANSSENFTKAARREVAALPMAVKGWVIGVYSELNDGSVLPKDTHPLPIPNPSPSLGDKETVTVTVTETVNPLPPSDEGEKPKPKSIRSIKTPVPDNLVEVIPPEVWSAIGEEQHLTDDQLRYETVKMIDHYRGKSERRADWIASWRSWMRSEYRKSTPIHGANGIHREHILINGRQFPIVDGMVRLGTIDYPPEIAQLEHNHSRRLKYEQDWRDLHAHNG